MAKHPLAPLLLAQATHLSISSVSENMNIGLNFTHNNSLRKLTQR
jgi:hypothetical protein